MNRVPGRYQIQDAASNSRGCAEATTHHPTVVSNASKPPGRFIRQAIPPFSPSATNGNELSYTPPGSD
jgi:hypothetical protein